MSRRILGIVHESAIYRFLSHLIGGGIPSTSRARIATSTHFCPRRSVRCRDDARAIIPAP